MPGFWDIRGYDRICAPCCCLFVAEQGARIEMLQAQLPDKIYALDSSLLRLR